MSDMRFQSGAWWTVPPEVDGPPTDGARYERRGLLGIGGMGRVRLAWDPDLKREVALKEPRDDAGAEALSREAWVTARLEHPGVPPVYDVGAGPDGRPWFAMRRVRGRSLRDVLPESDRGTLLRHMLGLCQVMAFAHDRHVVHRDLKPDNVMVGEYGETVVLDWGLAVQLPVEDAGSGAAGTPGYMSPERLAGAAPDPREDVWAIGAMLFEVLAGRPAFTGPDAAAVQARVRAEPPPVPPADAALQAVVARALAPAEARYPDAGALGRDLAAWLDGRPVTARPDTLGAALVRAVRANRGLVSFVTMVLVAAGIAAVVGVGRVATERARTVAALADAEAGLHRLLVARARQAAADGDRAAAEILAAHALARGPSPAAAGVFARWGAQARPAHQATVRTSACRAGAAWAGDLPICVAADGLVGVDPASGAARWSTAGGLWGTAADAPVLVVVGGGAVRVLDAVSGTERAGLPVELPGRRDLAVSRDGAWAAVGGDDPQRWTLNPLAPVPWSPCGATAALEVAVDAGQAWALCADGVVRWGPVDGEPHARAVTPFEQGPGEGMWLTVVEAGRALLVGDGDALVEVTGAGTRVLAQLGARPRSLSVDGDRVLVATADGRARVLDLGGGGTRAALPSGRHMAVRLRGSSVQLLGARLERWALAPDAEVVRYDAGVGLMPTVASPGGRVVAAAGVDGKARVWDPASGRRLATLAGEGGALKWLDFAPDGQWLAVAEQRPGGVWRVATSDWATRDQPFPALRSARRVLHVGDQLLAAGYDAMLRWSPASGPAEDLGVVDVARAGGRSVLLTGDGTVLSVGPDGTLAPLASLPGARRVAVDASGALAVTTPDGVTRLGADGGGRQDVGVADAASVALAGDRLVVGRRDGRVEVRGADGTLEASLEGHDDVVASVALLDADTVLSGSWDGTVRRWRLGSPPPPGEVEAAWGRTLDDVLER